VSAAWPALVGPSRAFFTKEAVVAEHQSQRTRTGITGDVRDLTPSPSAEPVGEGPGAAGASPLPPEQLTRWAHLVADGREAMPAGLTPAQHAEMLRQVRRLRRRRLVRYIARQVALDLHRDQAGPAGG
jgi:hypothetical protein